MDIVLANWTDVARWRTNSAQ